MSGGTEQRLDVNGVTPPPPPDCPPSADDDEMDAQIALNLIVVHAIRTQPELLKLADLWRGAPLEEIFSAAELERMDDYMMAFKLLVALIIGLLVAN